MIVRKMLLLRRRDAKKRDHRVAGKRCSLRRRGDKKKEERIVGKMLSLRRRGDKKKEEIGTMRIRPKILDAVNGNEETLTIERVSIVDAEWLEEKNNSKVYMDRTIFGMLMNYPLMTSFGTLRRILEQL